MACLELWSVVCSCIVYKLWFLNQQEQKGLVTCLSLVPSIGRVPLHRGLCSSLLSMRTGDLLSVLFLTKHSSDSSPCRAEDRLLTSCVCMLMSCELRLASVCLLHAFSRHRPAACLVGPSLGAQGATLGVARCSG